MPTVRCWFCGPVDSPALLALPADGRADRGTRTSRIGCSEVTKGSSTGDCDSNREVVRVRRLSGRADLRMAHGANGACGRLAALTCWPSTQWIGPRWDRGKV